MGSSGSKDVSCGFSFTAKCDTWSPKLENASIYRGGHESLLNTKTIYTPAILRSISIPVVIAFIN